MLVLVIGKTHILWSLLTCTGHRWNRISRFRPPWKRCAWASRPRSSSAPSMRETLPSQLGSPRSQSSLFPEGTHSATSTPHVTCTEVQHSFLTIYATLWKAVITLVPYDCRDGWEQQNPSRSSERSSDCLWQMEMKNLSLFGDPWGFGHLGRPKLSWFFLQWEAEL